MSCERTERYFFNGLQIIQLRKNWPDNVYRYQSANIQIHDERTENRDDGKVNVKQGIQQPKPTI